VFNWLDSYSQFIGTSLLVDVLLVMSLFVVFQCGVLSLATVGFMADGAYLSSLLVLKAHWNGELAIAAGAVGTGLIALVFGRLVLRLRGIYLALGTFALGQVCVLIIANISITGGNQGLVGMPHDIDLTKMFFIVLILCVLLQLLHRSRVGRALRAMRVDDRLAAGVGVNTVRYRTLAFTASGVLAGLAGGCEAFRTSVISPDQYSFTLLVQMLALAMIGGSFHWAGGVIAAIAIGALQQEISLAGPTANGFLYGGLLVVVMLLLPEGIVDRRLLRRVRRRRERSADLDEGTMPALQAVGRG
jgi:branched-chain amino acid transport system permease protein